MTIEEEHKDKFGVEPIIIGINFNDADAVANGIFQAIQTNTPYNEYHLLTKEEQKSFDNGELVF